MLNRSSVANRLFLATVAGSITLSSAAFADVQLFQARKAPSLIRDDLRAGTNLGTTNQGVVRFLERNKSSLNLTKVNSEILELRKVQKDKGRTTLRYIQRHHRVRIEGAELIALIDANGALEALNSSLIETPSLSVQPEISREDALKSAAAQLGYEQPDVAKEPGNGLLIATSGNRPALVWQFSIREGKNGANPVQVQILAQGAGKGQIHKIISLGHGAVDASVVIYDASVSLVIPNPIFKGLKVMENGKPTLKGVFLAGREAKNANRNFEAVKAFYSGSFDRNSWDGEGAMIEASVNNQKITYKDFLGQKENAAWIAPWKLFIFGAGGASLTNFTGSLDVVGHEYTHAVVSSSTDLAYEGQSGALNEHLADVFGAMIQSTFERDSNPWHLGEGTLTQALKDRVRDEEGRTIEALRDMLHPEKGLSEQPRKVSEIGAEFGPGCKASPDNDNCGVHILSGIPNRAAALIIDELGWERVRDVYYQVMTSRLRSSSDFNDYRDQMLAECKATLSGASCGTMEAAFKEVGML